MKNKKFNKLQEQLTEIKDQLSRIEKKLSNDVTNICSVCGIDFNSTTAYVCTNSICPSFSRITTISGDGLTLLKSSSIT